MVKRRKHEGGKEYKRYGENPGWGGLSWGVTLGVGVCGWLGVVVDRDRFGLGVMILMGGGVWGFGCVWVWVRGWVFGDGYVLSILLLLILIPTRTHSQSPNRRTAINNPNPNQQ